MATDYDAPRRSETDELTEDSLEELKARRNEAQSGAVDVDESESAENFELPGADLSGEELTVRVLPKQADEFTCSSCFLVHHRSRLADQRNGRMVCRDCAA
jgi:formylmethanofuran dehydrogenase subunit E